MTGFRWALSQACDAIDHAHRYSDDECKRDEEAKEIIQAWLKRDWEYQQKRRKKKEDR